MVDALFLKERVENSIRIGESDFREFKSAYQGKPGNKKPRPVKDICKNIAQGLVAFANTDGGELIIGVEDDGIITGVPHSDKDIEIMVNAAESSTLGTQRMPIFHARVIIDGKVILFFQVEKGTNKIYQTSDGKVLIRQGKHTIPEEIEIVKFKRQEVMSREYDRQYVDGATVNDLDISLVQGLADSFIKGMTVEKCLQQSGLAEYSFNGLKIKRAALLLFAKDIQKWCPNSKVRFLKIKGVTLNSGDKYNEISDKTVFGNISELMYKSWEQLRPFLVYKTAFGADAKFEEQYIYPEYACREALVNAIAHRDYVSHNGVEVHIYDDRIEVEAPGTLLSTLTVKDLEALENRHESRNATITYILKVSKYMREIGEGMKRMFTLMQEKELEKPKLYSNTSWFTVTLFNKSVYSEKQMEFLKQFDKFKLSVNQKKIVLLGIDGKALSQNNILKAINTENWNDDAIKKLQRLKIIHQSKKDQEVLYPQQPDTKQQSDISIRKIRTLPMKKEHVPKYKIVIP